VSPGFKTGIWSFLNFLVSHKVFLIKVSNQNQLIQLLIDAEWYLEKQNPKNCGTEKFHFLFVCYTFET
jgi:hypothetical protein